MRLYLLLTSALLSKTCLLSMNWTLNILPKGKMKKTLKVNNVPQNFLTAIALLYEDQCVN